jgi:hypothetical protein
MMLDDKDTAIATTPQQSQFLCAGIYESSLNFSPSPDLDFLSNGLVKIPSATPFVHLFGIGTDFWAHIFRESDDGIIDLRGSNLGHLVHESDEEIDVTQPIEAMKASLRRSAHGVDLHIEAVVGPLSVKVYGSKPPPEEQPDTSHISAARTLAIDAFVPMALLAARRLPGRTSRHAVS